MKYPCAGPRPFFGVLLIFVVVIIPMTAAVAADQPTSETENQSTLYTYHDDWAIVSAPPPPGPYQSVNVDPRIPGQEDVIPSFAGGFDAPAPHPEELPENLMSAPPAAGGSSPAPTGVYPSEEPYGYEPPPGYYNSRGYSPQRPSPRQAYGSPYGYPQSSGPRYGYAPAPRSSAPVQRAEDEVPPPPNYNRMLAPPSPGYRGGAAPDQRYRRSIGTQ